MAALAQQNMRAARCPAARPFGGRAVAAAPRGARVVAMAGKRNDVSDSYAKALVELAEEKNTLEAVHADVDAVAGLIKENTKLSELMFNPVVEAAKKKAVIAKISKEAGFQKYTTNFLNLLVEKDRVNLLNEICESFEEQYCTLTDTQVATLRSAVKLEQEQQFLIAKKLQELTGSKNIKLKPVIDQSLIAGFVVEYGSSQIDLSIRGQIEKVAEELTRSMATAVSGTAGDGRGAARRRRLIPAARPRAMAPSGLSLRRLLAVAAAVRGAYLAAVLLGAAALRDYDTSAALLSEDCRDGWPAAVAAAAAQARAAGRAPAAHPWVVWDSVFFARIAACGYEYEQYHAFFPGLPGVVRLLRAAGVARGPAAFSLITLALNNALFLLSVALLARLSQHVLRDDRLACGAALLFVLSPASVHHALLYTEALFTAASWAGLYALYCRRCSGAAALAFAASAATRSNGLLNAGFLLHEHGRRALAAWPASRAAAAREALSGGLACAVVAAPWAAYTAYGHAQFCTGVYGGAAARPWCGGALPSAYGYVQRACCCGGPNKTDGSGGLSAAASSGSLADAGAAPGGARPPAIPGVAFQPLRQRQHAVGAAARSPGASPAGSAADLRSLGAGAAAAGAGGGGGCSCARGRGFYAPAAAVFVLHWAALTGVCLAVMHIQVATRFLSSCAPLYWFGATALAHGPPRLRAALWWHAAAFMGLGGAAMAMISAARVPAASRARPQRPSQARAALVHTLSSPLLGRRSTRLVPRRRATRTAATEVVEAPEALAAAEADAAVAAGAAPAAAPAPAGAQPINWYQQWYPLAIIQDLDPRRPTAAHLLGEPVVLWRDGGGAWRCLADRCPHRLAPLSEGRIDANGTLMCSYHGWEFNGAGACTRIPQIGDPKAAATACSSGRSCVASYPVKELHGLLWVWGDASAAGAAASLEKAPATIPELDDPADWEPRTGWFMRDIPISMETVVENVVDPCHAPWTHHKVQGVRGQEKGTEIRPLSPPLPGGFKMEQDSGRFKATFEFVAPCFIKYTFPVFGRVMAVYVVPTRPGWCRMVTRFVKSRHSYARRPGLMGLVLKAMEFVEGNRVLEHALMRNKVLDGDNHILHVQERELLAEGAAGWQRAYYMPGTSDTGVAAWRSWLSRYGSAMPLLPRKLSDLPPLMSRRESLDRFGQHTAHCPDCHKALKRIDLALPLTWAAAAAALLVAGVAAASGAPLLSGRVAGGAAAAALLALLHRSLAGFRELFVFRDYVHADVP
ncbi:hypothetical protein HT031_000882 [Scenedesmus sp. PABB004]|nr:hypothetical protein HT031_000882 [Scenedesmus sp. PABB004]